MPCPDTAGQGSRRHRLSDRLGHAGPDGGGRGPLAAACGAGIDYLLRTQARSGLWEDDWFTAPGFPRVFYLKYHGYDPYFPLWALARYGALLQERPT